MKGPGLLRGHAGRRPERLCTGSPWAGSKLRSKFRAIYGDPGWTERLKPFAAYHGSKYTETEGLGVSRFRKREEPWQLQSPLVRSSISLCPRRVRRGLARRFSWPLLGTLLLTLSAKTKVVLGPVDMSLQTLAVLLIAAVSASASASRHCSSTWREGAMGLPVFQSTPEKGIGVAYMLGSTGGYLAGFVVMAAIVGWAADRGLDRNPLKLFGVMLAAERGHAGHGLCLAGGADRRGKGMDLRRRSFHRA